MTMTRQHVWHCDGCRNQVIIVLDEDPSPGPVPQPQGWTGLVTFDPPDSHMQFGARKHLCALCTANLNLLLSPPKAGDAIHAKS